MSARLPRYRVVESLASCEPLSLTRMQSRVPLLRPPIKRPPSRHEQTMTACRMTKVQTIVAEARPVIVDLAIAGRATLDAAIVVRTGADPVNVVRVVPAIVGPVSAAVAIKAARAADLLA
ncbi:MAG TPA: hypothetical protein VKB78_01575 [Pirellulales bacterium]|nr:hypothetical protein [Pirellulales bacterium]